MTNEIDRDNEQFNKGVLHTVDLLAKALNATGWYAGDGSEDYDEDLTQTLFNILIAAGLWDADENQPSATKLRSSNATLVAHLRCAIGHIDHMAAWVSNPDRNKGSYSFESLGEDMPSIRAALSAGVA